jgi:hypothetical protein
MDYPNQWRRRIEVRVMEISPDDRDFEEIFGSLQPGLVLVVCSPKSLRTLRSFCCSLKQAALRRGSDAMLLQCNSSMDFETIGNQIVEHGTRGVRVFLLNRFDDPTPGAIVTRLKCNKGFDGLDGSIQAGIAGMLQDVAASNGFTLLVTTVAKKERQIIARRTARILGKEQGVLIALEQPRIGDDWYSATVTSGPVEKHYGPLYYMGTAPDSQHNSNK